MLHCMNDPIQEVIVFIGNKLSDLLCLFLKSIYAHETIASSIFRS